MGRKFVAGHRHKRLWIKLLSILTLVFLSAVVAFNLMMKIRFKMSTKILSGETLFSYGTNQESILSLDLLDPSRILKVGLNYVLEVNHKESTPELELIKQHVNDAHPVVYIYNSHESESYDSSLIESYNIKYNVKLASYILSDYLKDLGIPSYVEPESIGKYMEENDLLYKDSYVASAHFIKKRIEEYPSIEMIIDLHRDSIGRNASTVSIDGKTYAKVMFVVGMDYEGYEDNLELAENLNSRIDPKLSRGISKKTGLKVNGVYNQNLLSKALLIEVGGVDNTILEAANSLKLIAEALFDMREENHIDGEEEN